MLFWAPVYLSRALRHRRRKHTSGDTEDAAEDDADEGGGGEEGLRADHPPVEMDDDDDKGDTGSLVMRGWYAGFDVGLERLRVCITQSYTTTTHARAEGCRDRVQIPALSPQSAASSAWKGAMMICPDMPPRI